MSRTIEAATELDVLQAQARFSKLVDGIQPAIATDGRLELRAARHPLLIPALQRHLGVESAVAGDGDDRPAGRGREPVPVDILLIPPARVLVITGPNTGGKTVALKTAGLLALMAQAGLLIPAADGTQMPVFRSGLRRHRRRAVDRREPEHLLRRTSPTSSRWSKALALPALVLLDEAGGGTDPVEGGALAMAIIDHFRRRGAMVVATTHYDSLKSYASTTDGRGAGGVRLQSRRRSRRRIG